MKKLLSAFIAMVIMIGLLPATGFAASEKVTIYGNSISVHAKQICFVIGDKDDTIINYMAEDYYAPGFKNYYYIPKETAVDFKVIAEKLPELQNLAVVYGEVKNLSALADMKDLVWLGLYNNDGTEKLSFLKNLTQLKKFRYSNWDCESIKPVSYLKNVTELYLDVRAKAATDISPLKGLTKVKKLTIGYGGFEDLSALSGMKNLQELEVDSTYLSDISALEDLKKLTSLTINRTDSIKGADIAKLSGLTYLELNNMEMKDFENITKLENLKSLSISGLTGISVVRFNNALAHMTQLEELVLVNMPIHNLNCLKGLKNLRELGVLLSDIDDISGIKNLTNLQTLYLTHNKITDISALKKLTNLTYLNLNENSIEDISPIKNLTKLKYLGLSNSYYFDDPSPILKLTQLEELYVPGTAVDEEFAKKYKKINPNCEITYKYD